MIEIEDIRKSYGKAEVLKGVTMTVPAGESLALVGYSGCGKTTLLRLIVGLEKPDAGKIRIGGTEVSSPARMVAPNRRGVALIFQDLALWPHMKAREHIEFVLKNTGSSSQDIRARTAAFLDDVRLNGHGERYPHQLSGGEKQRLAIARALAAKPAFLLMDEPFTNLDYGLKEELQELIVGIKKSLGMGIIYVTHNAEEVRSLADRTLILNGGKLEEIDGEGNVDPRNVELVRRILKVC